MTEYKWIQADDGTKWHLRTEVDGYNEQHVAFCGRRIGWHRTTEEPYLRDDAPPLGDRCQSCKDRARHLYKRVLGEKG